LEKPVRGGVDKDEVGLVEEPVLVGDDLVRGGAGGFGTGGDDAHGADRAHVEPEGGGAGTAVVEEGDRAGVGIGAVEGVGDREDAAVGMVVVAVADDEGACGCGIVEGFAVESEVVVGDGVLLRWDGGGGLGFVACVAGVRFIGVAGLLLRAHGRQGADEQSCQQEGAGQKGAGPACQLAQGDLRRDSTTDGKRRGKTV
jgi:hypothetical protein